ncbi:MAG: protein kinase [Planctomycetes bacterium]|nr:protein kinase [Planctomycetota bacterium]
MVCPACGARVEEGSKFCKECGSPVGATPAPASDTNAGATISGDCTRILPGAAALEPGQLFHDRYRIERLIGQGGMGTVYLARDEVTEDAVCLKVIRPELLRSEAAGKRFLREGKVSRGIRHRNVVAVYDVNVAGESYYLSMEYLEGMSLRRWLQRNLAERRDVPLDVACRILREILEGLGAAHGADLIHRDLKPENVILLGEPLDGPFALKILDFGIARPLRASEQLTVEGASMGTPVYMAPEQETSAGIVGPEADLYSAGVIFYEMLLGVPPRGRWDLPREVRSDLPAAVDEICTKALHAHPARRFQSVAEFAAALEAIGSAPRAAPAEARPAPARPDRPPPRKFIAPTRPKPLPPKPAKVRPAGSTVAAPPSSGSALRAPAASPAPQRPSPGLSIVILAGVNFACALAGFASSGWLGVELAKAFPMPIAMVLAMSLPGTAAGLLSGSIARLIVPRFGWRGVAIWTGILAGAFGLPTALFRLLGARGEVRSLSGAAIFAAIFFTVLAMTIAQIRAIRRAAM